MATSSVLTVWELKFEWEPFRFDYHVNGVKYSSDDELKIDEWSQMKRSIVPVTLSVDYD